jgi:hypothetical protein
MAEEPVTAQAPAQPGMQPPQVAPEGIAEEAAVSVQAAASPASTDDTVPSIPSPTRAASHTGLVVSAPVADLTEPVAVVADDEVSSMPSPTQAASRTEPVVSAPVAVPAEPMAVVTDDALPPEDSRIQTASHPEAAAPSPAVVQTEPVAVVTAAVPPVVPQAITSTESPHAAGDDGKTAGLEGGVATTAAATAAEPAASAGKPLTSVAAAVPDVPVLREERYRQGEALVIVDRTSPSAVRRVSERTGHVQLAFATPEGSVEVSNGNGYEGMARLMSRYYAGLGQQIAHITNARHFNHASTVIYYRAGKREVAEGLRASLPVAAALRETTDIRTDVRVVLGRDIGFYQGALRRITRSESRGDVMTAGYFDLATDDARIEVSNGNGRDGMARLLSRVLGHLGENVSRVTNADSFRYPTTVIHYVPDQEPAARALAERLPVDAELRPLPGQQARRHVGVRVIIGRDFLRYEQVMHDLLADMAHGETGV